MHYANGLKNAKVCVIDIDSNKTKFTCPATKDVSLYHSVKFQETEMILRRYYGIGEGIIQKYGKCAFQSGLNVKMPFHSTEPPIMLHTSTPKQTVKRKAREDRQLCTLLFCPTSGCRGTFDNKEDYDKHLLEGIHEFPKACSALDSVKKMFVSKMKSLSSSHGIFLLKQSLYRPHRCLKFR